MNFSIRIANCEFASLESVSLPSSNALNSSKSASEYLTCTFSCSITKQFICQQLFWSLNHQIQFLYRFLIYQQRLMNLSVSLFLYTLNLHLLLVLYFRCEAFAH